jgi:hypothetical protein
MAPKSELAILDFEGPSEQAWMSCDGGQQTPRNSTAKHAGGLQMPETYVRWLPLRA